MKAPLSIFLLALATAPIAHAEEFWDAVDSGLSYSGYHDQVRAHLSGTIDLEQYWFNQPAPELIYSTGTRLTTPRLTLYLDAQVGEYIYTFLQFRLDRGFDPSNGPLRGRIDEYAVRFTPLSDAPVSLQAGKFGTIVGNWVRRHGSWTDPFVTAPLPYSNLTGLPGSIPLLKPAAPATQPAGWPVYYYPGGGYLKNSYPIIWGPSYAQGISISGQAGAFALSAEVKSSSLASDPSDWDQNNIKWAHPTLSAEIRYQPSPLWNIGLSASQGGEVAFIAYSMTDGIAVGKYREKVLGQDFEFAWHHLQFWAEAYETRFEIQHGDRAELVGYYVEVKYQFAPRFFAALRWNQEIYGSLAHSSSTQVASGRDTWRIDVAPTYRFTPYTQAKLQYSFQAGQNAGQHGENLLALQLTQRF